MRPAGSPRLLPTVQSRPSACSGQWEVTLWIMEATVHHDEFILFLSLGKKSDVVSEIPLGRYPKAWPFRSIC